MQFLSNGQQLTRNIIRQTDVWMHNGRHSYSNAGFFFSAIIADGSQSKRINSGFLCMPHSCACVAVDEWTTLCVEVESVGTADTSFESSSNVDFLSDYLVARAFHFRFVFFLVSFVSLYPIRYERCFDLFRSQARHCLCAHWRFPYNWMAKFEYESIEINLMWPRERR